MAFKKKLYKFRAKGEEKEVEIHITKDQKRKVKATGVSLECQVRQMLAEKISGTHVGLWLLVPEHLRLGTWDLLKSWTGKSDNRAIDPRLGLQMVHESALCVNGVRDRRSLRQKGFETLNGLAFVGSDYSMHKLLDEHEISESLSLQLALGMIRKARGHYPGELVLLDPHRIATWSERQMQPKKAHRSAPLSKSLQTFFAIDAVSGQPFGFGIGSSAVTVTQATISLVKHLEQILPNKAIVVADAEHYTVELLNYLCELANLKFLMPAPRYTNIMKTVKRLDFKRVWAGYSVGSEEYQPAGLKAPIRLIGQRTGEREENYDYKPFITNSELPAQDLMNLIFPERWNIEEFFNSQANLGFNRASTMNLHIRFGKLSMALMAQAACYQLRQKLSGEMRQWNAKSLAEKFFSAIDGDIRVRNDTIIVTFYNAPNAEKLRKCYQNLPEKLKSEGINPRVPWLYDFQVDFRFK